MPGQNSGRGEAKKKLRSFTIVIHVHRARNVMNTAAAELERTVY